MPNNDQTILALDVGSKRIGVAAARLDTRLPQPLKTLERSEDSWAELKQLAEAEQAAALVVGLPRNLEGEDTKQTHAIRDFTHRLKEIISLPVYYQDEALTSHMAEQELSDRGITYNKGMVDAIAATYILSDFLESHPEVS